MVNTKHYYILIQSDESLESWRKFLKANALPTLIKSCRFFYLFLNLQLQFFDNNLPVGRQVSIIELFYGK